MVCLSGEGHHEPSLHDIEVINPRYRGAALITCRLHLLKLCLVGVRGTPS